MPNLPEEREKNRTERLLNELSVWRHNRLLYPGWVLAPYQVRDQVWLHTKYWVDTAVAVEQNWLPGQLLVLWRELSWRLNLCLQLIPSSAFATLQRIVDNNVILDAIQDRSTALVELFPHDNSWPEDLRFETATLRQEWIACALQYLSASRVRPDIEGFEKSIATLVNIGGLTQDQQCALSYQRCLHALAELNRTHVSQILEGWPTQAVDPYWFVRRASIHLELGEVEIAKSLARDALQRIRKFPRGEKVDYWRLSREAWCLRFIEQAQKPYKLSEHGRGGILDQDESQRSYYRDNELEAARCSPDTELRMLRERIRNRLPPVERPHTTRNSPNFDHGYAGETHHFGGHLTIERLAPAINALRACDVTGLTPRVENVVYFADEVQSALQWVRDDLPGLWSAFALRHQGIGLGSDVGSTDGDKPDAIRRATLENLPLRHIRRLAQAIGREMHHVLDTIESRGVTQEGSRLGERVWALRKFGDVLARVSMCLEPEQRESVLTLLFRLAREQSLSGHPSFQEAVHLLVQRTVPYLTLDQTNTWLEALIVDFPLLGRSGDHHDRWPLVTDFIWAPREDGIDRPQSSTFDAGVKRLIGSVSQGNIRERTVAAERLAFLQKVKILSDVEEYAFEEALWSQTDSYELPELDASFIARFVHLDWPLLDKKRAIRGLSEWILHNAVGDRFRTEVMPDGQEKKVLPSRDLDDYLESISGIESHLRRKESSFDDAFDESVRTHILRSIFQWWKRERGLYVARRSLFSAFDGDPYDRLRDALRVILHCVLDAESRDREYQEELSEFMRDMEHLPVELPYRLPICVFLDGGKNAEYWREMLHYLWQGDEHIARQALSATLGWQREANRLKLPEMPQDVALTIISSLARVDGEFSYDSYGVIGNLLAERKMEGEDLLRSHLRYAAEEAAARLAYGREEGGGIRPGGFYGEMRAHFRRRLAALIFAMRENNVPVGVVADTWWKEAKEDRFVDIQIAAHRGRWA